jgi:hypothetical protein
MQSGVGILPGSEGQIGPRMLIGIEGVGSHEYLES